MTVTYGFYDSLNGDRKYNAKQMTQLFDGLIEDGIFETVGGNLIVSVNSGMNINVATGRAWLNYTWTYNDTTLVLGVQASEAVLNRIDTVVVEVNTDVSVRANTIKIIKGTPASSPVAPTLSNTATNKQYPLADIYVGAGVTSLTAPNITNRVGVVGGTPFVTGALPTVNITDLLTQYEAAFSNWFVNLQNQLDANQAANLQNQIDHLNDGWLISSETWTYVDTDAPSFRIVTAGDQTTKYRVGYKFKLTQTTIKYFFITKVEYSGGNTTLTLYGGTDFTLFSSPAITLPYYSKMKAPSGFPLSEEKWTFSSISSAAPVVNTPTQNVWYNPGTGTFTSIPLGAWVLGYEAVVALAITPAAISTVGCRVTLSTLTNGESDPELTSIFSSPTPGGSPISQIATYQKRKAVTLTAKTPWYLNVLTGAATATSITVNPASAARIVIRARCAYL